MSLEDDLVELHRRQQMAVRARLVAQLLLLWPALDPENLDDTFLAWALAVATTVDTFRALSSAVSEQFVAAVRALSGAPGEPVVVAAAPVVRERVLRSLSVTGPIGIKQAMLAGTPLQAAVGTAFNKTTAAASRLVLDGGREAVAASVNADPAGLGWKRVNGHADCKWCRERVGRLLTDDHFGAHDHCSCTAVPVFAS
jgi:hypothetical protein